MQKGIVKNIKTPRITIDVDTPTASLTNPNINGEIAPAPIPTV